MGLDCSFWYVLQWKYCAARWYRERLPVHKTSAFTLFPLFLGNLLAEMWFGIFYAAKKAADYLFLQMFFLDGRVFWGEGASAGRWWMPQSHVGPSLNSGRFCLGQGITRVNMDVPRTGFKPSFPCSSKFSLCSSALLRPKGIRAMVSDRKELVSKPPGNRVTWLWEKHVSERGCLDVSIHILLIINHLFIYLDLTTSAKFLLFWKSYE